jgi:hypothetical protein
MTKQEKKLEERLFRQFDRRDELIYKVVDVRRQPRKLQAAIDRVEAVLFQIGFTCEQLNALESRRAPRARA